MPDIFLIRFCPPLTVEQKSVIARFSGVRQLCATGSGWGGAKEEQMLKFLTTAGLALAMSAGALTGAVTSAQAQDVQLRIGPDGIRPVIPDRDRDRDGDRYDRRGGCSEREARRAARESGLRDAEVTRVTRRSITVEGMTRRGPDRITFANERGCPEI